MSEASREDDLLSSGGRSLSAEQMGVTDASALITAFVATPSPTRAPALVRRLRASQRLADQRDGALIRRFHPASQAGDLYASTLECIIIAFADTGSSDPQATPEIVISYENLADEVVIELHVPEREERVHFLKPGTWDLSKSPSVRQGLSQKRSATTTVMQAAASKIQATRTSRIRLVAYS